MNDREMMAQEKLLREAHAIVGERIDDKSPGPYDDAQAEYLEECLIGAAREFVAATVAREIAVGPTCVPRPGECTLPPAGWWCSRGEGHEGPCAPWPVPSDA